MNQNRESVIESKSKSELASQNQNQNSPRPSIVESEFLFDIMRLKTTSRERELRRVTKELSTFISKAALDTKDEDTLFAQRLLSNTLRIVATEIEPKENRQPNQPMLDAWVEALRTGMEEYLEDM